MGDFATTTSIGNILVRYLVNNTTSSDTAGVNIFSAHIDRAESFVKAKIASKYSMPFTTVPPLVRQISEDIACYYVIRATNYQDSKQKNGYLDEFKTAFDTLKDVVDSKIVLTLTDGSLVASRSSQMFLSSNENYTPIFGKDDPTSWQRDPDEIEDTSNSRE